MILGPDGEALKVPARPQAAGGPPRFRAALSGGSIDQAVSFGPVPAICANKGGLLGFKQTGAALTNSAWDTDTSGLAASAGGTPLTDAALQALPAGFDTSKWRTYPQSIGMTP